MTSFASIISFSKNCS